VTHDKPGIAVAVIALNEALGMRRLLDTLLAEPFDEIAVADGGSTDGTLDIIAQEPRVRLVHAPRGRGRQINAAVKATRSPLLTILHADTLLPRGAAKLIRESLAPPDVAAGCFQLRFDVQHPVLDAYAWATRFETSLTTFGALSPLPAALPGEGRCAAKFVTLPFWPVIASAFQCRGSQISMHRRVARLRQVNRVQRTISLSRQS
jgi:glycosyltransferase involved in cell wall biosynthesis